MDRQDIDALLIGALYGELTPAEEARLAAHLESHPTDRGALDDLKRARQAVRESRIFDVQDEPPQAVSALLLQEAHRRAPRAAAGGAKESWFYRFTRAFLAHPAMAAAAMLVLVVGVAGTLYIKKGDQFAEQKAAAPAAEPEIAAPTEAPAAGRGFGESGAAGMAGSAYSVGLRDTPIENAPTTTATAEESEAKPQGKLDANGRATDRRAEPDPVRRREAAKNKQSTIVVGRPRPQPKDLDAPRAKASPGKGGEATTRDEARFDDAEGADSAQRVTVGGAGAAATGAPAQAAPSPTANTPQMSPPPPPRSAPVKTAKKEAQQAPAERSAPAKDNALFAWAKAEHNRAVTLAGNGDCRGAARLAVAVEGRAPGYYAQYMATDRALKRCQAYVAAERDAEAERAAKARASKRATDK